MTPPLPLPEASATCVPLPSSRCHTPTGGVAASAGEAMTAAVTSAAATNEMRFNMRSLNLDGTFDQRPVVAFTCELDERLSAAGVIVTFNHVWAPIPLLTQHAPDNAMDDAGEVARFHDRCSELMRALLCELARTPDAPRPFPEIEDALGWPHRRIASVLG